MSPGQAAAPGLAGSQAPVWLALVPGRAARSGCASACVRTAGSRRAAPPERAQRKRARLMQLPLRLNRAVLALLARGGRRQPAPHSRPPLGHAPRQPLLSGPRSSPFHHVLTLQRSRCPTGHPGPPLPPRAVAHVTIIPRQIRPSVTDIAGSLVVTTVLPRSRVTYSGHYVPTGHSTHEDARKRGPRALICSPAPPSRCGPGRRIGRSPEIESAAASQGKH